MKPENNVLHYLSMRMPKLKIPKKFRDDLFIEWNKLDALGRTHVAKEGINAQMSVPAENFETFRGNFRSV